MMSDYEFKIGDMVSLFERLEDGTKKQYLGFITEINLKDDLYHVDNYYSDTKFIVNKGRLNLLKVVGDEPQEQPQTQLLSNNEFIYFKDIDLIVSKDEFKRNKIDIQDCIVNKVVDKFIYGYSVYLGNTSLYKSENIDNCKDFISRLAQVLGSDIL